MTESSVPFPIANSKLLGNATTENGNTPISTSITGRYTAWNGTCLTDGVCDFLTCHSKRGYGRKEDHTRHPLVLASSLLFNPYPSVPSLSGTHATDSESPYTLLVGTFMNHDQPVG